MQHVSPIKRRQTRQIRVGNVLVGGDAPISVQSMTNTETCDVAATVAQIQKMEQAGVDLVRVSVPSMEAAEAFGEIRKLVNTPLIADIHFDYKIALRTAELGVDCLRINPGNIGREDRVREVVAAARDKGISIRIGVNAGSLEKDLQKKYGEPTPAALVESAMRHVDYLDRLDFQEYKVSVKASDVFMAVEAYRQLSQRIEQPLHLGITEAGAMSAWIAAATAYSNHNQPMLPFYAFYSMFGFQRIGDLAWAAGDIRARGFLMGGTAGRTTLNGEGLQHQDGHSHILAGTIPNCHAYDPAYGYEMAVIIREGIYQMLELQKDRYYYITMMNEAYEQPAMPEREGIEQDIVRGMYLLEEDKRSSDLHVQLLGSGTILLEVREAAKILRDEFGVGADVWSVTSFNELRRDCLDAERWNRLHPRETTRLSHLENCLQDRRGPVVASTDYMKLYADQVRQWVPQNQYKVLGTDGFGRSDSHKKLRHFFEVDRHWVVLAALEGLVAQGQMDAQVMLDAMQKFGIDANKPNPLDC